MVKCKVFHLSGGEPRYLQAFEQQVSDFFTSLTEGGGVIQSRIISITQSSACAASGPSGTYLTVVYY